MKKKNKNIFVRPSGGIRKDGCLVCHSNLISDKKKKTNYPVICSKCKTINRRIIDKCHYCGSSKSLPWGKPLRDFYAVQCLRCSLVYLKNPLSENMIKYYYDSYLSNVHSKFKQKKIMRAKMYKIELDYLISCINNFKKIKNVLDVGCGGGFFLDLFKKYKKKTCGVEISKDSYLQAKKKHNMYYGEFNQKIKFRKKFDLIIMRGVIEHVFNPKYYIKLGQKILKKGGYFFITATPKLDSIAADIFKERWIVHSPESHVMHFTESHIDSLFIKNKFSKKGSNSLYMNTPYENFKSDIKIIANEIEIQKSKRTSNVMSPAFFGSMMTVVYQKN